MTILKDCTLTYFGIPGRGEATRLALAIGKIPFEDKRIEFADWKDIKPTTPWGSLPMITLKDGTKIAQQRAILRLVGKDTGLYPTDPMAAALVDSVMDAGEDLVPKVMAIGAGMEQKEKEAARSEACQPGGVLYGLLEKLDQFIAMHGKSGHAVGECLTISDLYLFTHANNFVSGLFDGIPADANNSFSHIMALRKMVRAQPAVVQWYENLQEDIKGKLPASYAPLE